MNKAIILDRDGVINADQNDYTWKIADFSILPGVFEACKKWQQEGYLLIVITNQGGIAKGLYGHHEVRLLHDHMLRLFSEQGIAINDIYYCPHHPVAGECLCRKPGSLLVEKAIATHNIDPSLSVFIGDRDRDIIAGAGAGVPGLLVSVNSDLMLAYQKFSTMVSASKNKS